MQLVGRLPQIIGAVQLLLLFSTAARASQSTFQLASIEPAPSGARVTISYFNEWGNPQANEANRQVKLWVYNRLPSGAGTKSSNEITNAVEAYQNAHDPIVVDMPGTGVATFEIDYAQWGFSAGEPLYMHARWPNNHGWGEPWSAWGRSAGTTPLPAPQAAATPQSRLARKRPAWDNLTSCDGKPAIRRPATMTRRTAVAAQLGRVQRRAGWRPRDRRGAGGRRFPRR